VVAAAALGLLLLVGFPREWFAPWRGEAIGAVLCGLLAGAVGVFLLASSVTEGEQEFRRGRQDGVVWNPVSGCIGGLGMLAILVGIAWVGVCVKGALAGFRAPGPKLRLFYAVARDDAALARLVLAENPDCDLVNEELTWDDVEDVRRGALPSAGNRARDALLLACGEPPLALAAGLGYVDVARVLLDHGAHPGGSTMSSSPLYTAARRGDVRFARLLLDRGANVNARTFGDHAPLHIAADSGRVEVVQLLVDHGADVNARDHGGLTPLHYAADSGRVEVVQLLVDHGADADAEDAEGRTPLGLARDPEVQALLRERLAGPHALGQPGAPKGRSG
jgi:ankyrin repeat protein